MNQPYLGDFHITKLYGTPPPVGMTYSAGKHAGIDLVGINDKIIRAVKGGTVYRSGLDCYGWGEYVAIKQEDGLYAIYCHMSKRYKVTGQSVKAGEMLGIEGATGKVTGQHLHFEIRKNYTDKYSTINPTEYLGLENKEGLATLANKDYNVETMGKMEQKYNTMTEIKAGASWAASTIRKIIDKGYIKGNGKRDANGDPADLDLSMDMIRILVINDNAGAYGD